MKTELDWVSVKKNLPPDWKYVLVKITNSTPFIFGYIDKGEWFTFPGNERIQDAFNYAEVELWAYVNLPEENMYEIICDDCEKIIGETNKKPHVQNFRDLCDTCSMKNKEGKKLSEEEKDGWIWPLKQLPEENKKVELKTLNDGEILGFFVNGYFKRHFSENCDCFIDNVIAWRPIRQEKITEENEKCIWIFPGRNLPEDGLEVEVFDYDGNKITNAVFRIIENVWGFYDKSGQHVRYVFGWRPIKEEKKSPVCPECNKSFSREPIGEMGLISKSMYCDKCTESFKKEEQKKFKCGRCYKIYDKELEFQWGFFRICEECNKEVNKEENEPIKSDDKNSSCVFCDFIFGFIENGKICHKNVCNKCKNEGYVAFFGERFKLEKNKEPKFDFSKLKKGDAIVIEYKNKTKFLGFFAIDLDDAILRKEDIKKIIRINIDKEYGPIDFSLENKTKMFYEFEEI